MGDESKGRGCRTATGWVRFIYAGQTPATLGGSHEPVEPTAFPAKAVSLASEGVAEDFKLSNIVRRDIGGLQKRDSRLSAFELKGGPWCSPPKQPDHSGGAYFQTARRDCGFFSTKSVPLSIHSKFQGEGILQTYNSTVRIPPSTRCLSRTSKRTSGGTGECRWDSNHLCIQIRE